VDVAAGICLKYHLARILLYEEFADSVPALVPQKRR
jgi:hypothetical protein